MILPHFGSPDFSNKPDEKKYKKLKDNKPKSNLLEKIFVGVYLLFVLTLTATPIEALTLILGTL